MLQASLPPSSHAGGVGYQVDLLARALGDRGHVVTLFVVDGASQDTPYRCVEVAAATGQVRRLLGVGWSFARLDLSAYDVVHAHGDDWLFGRRRRVRTFYGSALMEARTATRLLRRGAQLCYYGLEWVSSVNPLAVAISDATRQYLPLVRATIPCAVDGSAFYPGGERTAEPSILFVAGTLEGRKRGSLLLETFSAIRTALPDARLTIVSRDRVSGPGISCFSGLRAPELGALYRSHWLLCSTSSYEGFGVPYVEALASGLPVVSTPNDGAREVLRDGALGVISSPGDLVRDIVALLSDADRRARLSGCGLAAAGAYSVAAVANQYERLYARAIGGPPVGAIRDSRSAG